MALTSVSFLMENLSYLINFNIHFILDEKDQIEYLHKELKLLRNFLHDWEGRDSEHEDLKTRITDLVQKAEDTVDLFVVDAFLKYIGKAKEFDYLLRPTLDIEDVKAGIKILKSDLMRINGENGETEVGKSSAVTPPSRDHSLAIADDTIVGFDGEAMEINERLEGGRRELDVISITGMAGQGKTTLAGKVYNDPLNVYHFFIRVWVSVSQKSRKRDLLLGILLSCSMQQTGGTYEPSDEKLLDEQLYKCLKGKRYLIVIDDIWDIKLWNELKESFPDDNNGSRIIITTRLTDVALRVKPNRRPHSLPFLTEGESWDLLRQKVFQEEMCPANLKGLGKKIAKRCQGLPLAIVLVAGILAKKENSQDCWEQVLEDLNSYVVGDPQQCMDTLSLSYNHLPDCLKQCFLYFGVFPQGSEIPVRKLIWLWVAEGFIAKTEHRSFEDIAEHYLMDMVGRNLVLVSKRRSGGGIKVCRVHDLLHNFCLIKAKEECFLQHISGHQYAGSSADFTHGFSQLDEEQIHFRFLTPHPHFKLVTASFYPQTDIRRLSVHADILHRICLYPYALNIRSFLCFATRCTKLPYGPTEFIYRPFKLLRVLDICDIPVDLYPCDIEELVLLRYLGLSVSFNYLPASISNLWNLETLVLSIFEFVTLPLTIFKMEKLRHLHIIGSGVFKVERLDDLKEEASDAGHHLLDSLETISRLYPRSCDGLLSRTPNLKALALEGPMLSDTSLTFPDLDHLNHLNKLKLVNTTRPSRFSWLMDLQQVKFPPKLTKLTLEKTYLSWKEMSILGMLPTLEILKLYSDAFIGPYWETTDGQFVRLKYLKLQSLQIVNWHISSNHFPILQHLILVGCRALNNLPSDLVEIPTLQTIEVRSCSYFAQFSATQIKQEQESIGNHWLKIIDHQYED